MEILVRAREALAAAERACANCRRMLGVLGVGHDAPAVDQGQPVSAHTPVAHQIPAGAADEAEQAAEVARLQEQLQQLQVKRAEAVQQQAGLRIQRLQLREQALETMLRVLPANPQQNVSVQLIASCCFRANSSAFVPNALQSCSPLLQNDTQNETLAGIKEAIELLRTTVGALQDQLAAGEVPTHALLDLAASADRLAERAAALAIEGLELLLQCCPACSPPSGGSCLMRIAVLGL